MYILPVLCRTFEKVHALHSQETKLSEKLNLLMTGQVQEMRLHLEMLQWQFAELGGWPVWPAAKSPSALSKKLTFDSQTIFSFL